MAYRPAERERREPRSAHLQLLCITLIPVPNTQNTQGLHVLGGSAGEGQGGGLLPRQQIGGVILVEGAQSR